MQIKVDDMGCWPTRAHPTDAGMDLRSMNHAIIMPGAQELIDTGVAVKIYPGMVGMVFNRSSQGKLGVVIANGTGIIDADYRGNIKVLLKNTGEQPYEVLPKNTRIAQLVVVPISIPILEKFMGTEDEWNDTKRGAGGFGSTGA